MEAGHMGWQPGQPEHIGVMKLYIHTQIVAVSRELDSESGQQVPGGEA